jgi:hypothetical protein
MARMPDLPAGYYAFYSRSFNREHGSAVYLDECDQEVMVSEVRDELQVSIMDKRTDVIYVGLAKQGSFQRRTPNAKQKQRAIPSVLPRGYYYAFYSRTFDRQRGCAIYLNQYDQRVEVSEVTDRLPPRLKNRDTVSVGLVLRGSFQGHTPKLIPIIRRESSPKE